MQVSDDDILAEYNSNSLRFLYPAAWELREEEDQADTVITITADDSCFCILRVMPATTSSGSCPFLCEGLPQRIRGRRTHATGYHHRWSAHLQSRSDIQLL